MKTNKKRRNRYCEKFMFLRLFLASQRFHGIRSISVFANYLKSITSRFVVLHGSLIFNFNSLTPLAI